MSDQQEKSKIIVDEDWKSQVQAEKDVQKQLKDEPQDAPPPGEEQASSGPLPPASFTTLVMTLATQAMAALGQLADTSGKPLPIDYDHAKHLIDTLRVLEEKTQGNLTTEEAAQLENIVHQLRLLYVDSSKQASPDLSVTTPEKRGPAGEQ